MEPTKVKPTIIECDCGQENELVKVKGVWCFDIQRHGNGEPFRGKCFNCSAAVAGPKGWTAPPVKGAKVAAGTEADRECMKGMVAQMERMERAMGLMEGKVNGLTEEKNQLAEENRQLRADGQEGNETDAMQKQMAKMAGDIERLTRENQQLCADGQEGNETETVNLKDMTIVELKNYADDKGISLPDGNKADLVAAIMAAEEG